MTFFAIILCADSGVSTQDVEKYVERCIVKTHKLKIIDKIWLKNCLHLRVQKLNFLENKKIQEYIVNECHKENLKIQVAITCCA